MTDYQALCREAEALFHGVPHPLANLANGAALLGMHLEDLGASGSAPKRTEGQNLPLGKVKARPVDIL